MAIATSNNNNVEFLGLTSAVRENILRALVGNLAKATWADTVSRNTNTLKYEYKSWNKLLDCNISNSSEAPSVLSGYTIFKDSDNLNLLATNNGLWVKVYPGRGKYSVSGETGSIDYDFCVYLALSSTEPAADGSNVTEPDAVDATTGVCDEPNYARFPLAYNGISQFLTICNAETDPAGNDGRNVNVVAAVNAAMQQEIKFNRSTQAWSKTYPYFALFTHPTDGKIIAWGKLTNAVEVTQADVVPLFEEGKFRLFFPAPNEVEAQIDADYNSATT